MPGSMPESRDARGTQSLPRPAAGPAADEGVTAVPGPALPDAVAEQPDAPLPPTADAMPPPADDGPPGGLEARPGRLERKFTEPPASWPLGALRRLSAADAGRADGAAEGGRREERASAAQRAKAALSSYEVIAASGLSRRIPLASSAYIFARSAFIGAPLDGWTPLEAAVLHFLRKSLSDGRLYANIQKQRRDMDLIALPTPRGVHVSVVYVPARPDLAGPALARSAEADAARAQRFRAAHPDFAAVAASHGHLAGAADGAAVGSAGPAPAPAAAAGTTATATASQAPTPTDEPGPARRPPAPLRALSSLLSSSRRATPPPPDPSSWVRCELVEWRGSGDRWPGAGPVVLYVHGGAWVVGSPRSHRWITAYLAKELGARVLAVDYALAPERPYPAAVRDVLAAYAYLAMPPAAGVAEHPTQAPPAGVAGCGVAGGVDVGGDSAGGNLSLALLHLSAVTSPAYPLPALPAPFPIPPPRRTFLLSPATDLTMSNPDYQLNRFDYLPWSPRPEHPDRQVHAYCANREMFTGLVSPGPWGWFGELGGAAPELGEVLVQVGGAERLWGQGVTAALRLASLGHRARVETYANMPHVFQIFAAAMGRPAGAAAMGAVAAFLREGLRGTPAADPADLPSLSCATTSPSGSTTPTTPAALRASLLAYCDRVRAAAGAREPKRRTAPWRARRDRHVPRGEVWEGPLGGWYRAAGEGRWEEAGPAEYYM